MEEKPKGKPNGKDQHLDALGPSKRGHRKTHKSLPKRAAKWLHAELHTQMEMSDRYAWLRWRTESNSYYRRKDKVERLKARIEIWFAKETIGKGAGRNYEDKRHRSRQIWLLLVDRTTGLLKHACNLIILKFFQLLNCHPLDEGGRK